MAVVKRLSLGRQLVKAERLWAARHSTEGSQIPLRTKADCVSDEQIESMLVAGGTREGSSLGAAPVR